MKTLFILIAFIFVQQITFGQFTAATPYGGITISKLRDFPDTYYKPGYEFGVSAEYLLNPKLSFKTAIGLEQKGGLVKGTGQGSSGAFSDYKLYISLNYINLPVMLKYNPFQDNGLYLIGGGYAGYLIYVTERFQSTYEGLYHNEKTSQDISHYYRWNAGLSIGGGYDIPIMEKGHINVETRFEFDVALEKNIFPTTYTFILSAGYSFNFKK